MEDWQSEMYRLFDMFERESTISLRKISRNFDAQNRSFDEQFRKYFKNMCSFRLDSSFNTVLFERQNRMQMTPSSCASNGGDAIESHAITIPTTGHRAFSNTSDGENASQPKIEKESDAPIEIVDSDGEDVVRTAHDTIYNPVELNPLLEMNDMILSINPVSNNDFVNEDDVNLKRECKIEEEVTRDVLPMVEFNPNENCENGDIANGIAADRSLQDHSQPSTSSLSTVQKQPERSQSKRFQCKHCKYTTKNNGHLRRHLFVHGGAKPFKCDHCGHEFRQKSDLLKHLKMHVRQKKMGVAPDPKNGQYKCKLCAQSFMAAKHLCVHMTKLHKSNQRLFNCAKCFRQYPSEMLKIRHEIKCRRRGFECYLCKYVTPNIGNIRHHMRTHSGVKSFECKICNKGFGFKQCLRRHLDSIHSQTNF